MRSAKNVGRGDSRARAALSNFVRLDATTHRTQQARQVLLRELQREVSQSDPHHKSSRDMGRFVLSFVVKSKKPFDWRTSFNKMANQQDYFAAAALAGIKIAEIGQQGRQWCYQFRSLLNPATRPTTIAIGVHDELE